MKKALKLLFACAFAMSTMFFTSYADTQKTAYSQAYRLRMSLYIPRIYNNNESLGWRKYQKQTINGTLFLEYDAQGYLSNISFSNLVNATHKLSNGKHVTYDGFLDITKSLKVVAIGNNKSKKFDVASVCFSVKAEPSYNIGAFDEDTSLYITLAGKGKIKNGRIQYVNGTAAGTLGCGCYAYGHTSPTRLIWWYGVSDIVTDIAAVHGTWKMTRIK